MRGGEEVQIEANLDYIVRSIRRPEADIVKGYQAVMPALAPVIGDENIDDLARYILQLGNLKSNSQK